MEISNQYWIPSFWGIKEGEWFSWLVFEPYPSEKYEVVKWDDDIPNWMEK